eukprot:10724343-Alexandrium_andersonii.AAC.1
MVPGPLYDLVQRYLGLCTTSYKSAWTIVGPPANVPGPCKRACAFVRARTQVPGPLYELAQRYLDLYTTSYKGPWTFVRPRTKVPGPL